MKDNVYLLRISLCESVPEIWRRVAVPADISLDRLHDIIQIVMGWQDAHLHEFIFGNRRFTEAPDTPEEGHDEALFRLNALIKSKGKTFRYLYDFGDGWMHEVVLENPGFDASLLPDALHCTGGERRCPPEDCGGTDGYRHLLSVIADPQHCDYEDTLTWLKGISDTACQPVFSPTHFDLNTINDRLEFYRRGARPRYLSFTEQ